MNDLQYTVTLITKEYTAKNTYILLYFRDKTRQFYAKNYNCIAQNLDGRKLWQIGTQNRQR